MSPNEARLAICNAVVAVAPDIDPDMIEDATDIRYDLDLDSMDFLNVVVAVHEATGIEVPERDYAQVETLQAFMDYLTAAAH